MATAECPASTEQFVAAEVGGEEEQSVASFVLLERLVELGVSATDVKKLKEAGFFTIDALFMRPRKVRRGAGRLGWAQRHFFPAHSASSGAGGREGP